MQLSRSLFPTHPALVVHVIHQFTSSTELRKGSPVRGASTQMMGKIPSLRGVPHGLCFEFQRVISLSLTNVVDETTWPGSSEKVMTLLVSSRNLNGTSDKAFTETGVRLCNLILKCRVEMLVFNLGFMPYSFHVRHTYTYVCTPKHAETFMLTTPPCLYFPLANCCRMIRDRKRLFCLKIKIKIENFNNAQNDIDAFVFSLLL